MAEYARVGVPVYGRAVFSHKKQAHKKKRFCKMLCKISSLDNYKSQVDINMLIPVSVFGLQPCSSHLLFYGKQQLSVSRDRPILNRGHGLHFINYVAKLIHYTEDIALVCLCDLFRTL